MNAAASPLVADTLPEPERAPAAHTPALERRFEELAGNHRAAFKRLAYRLTRDPEDAEDLLQETLLDAYRAFPRFQPESYFYSWVARIMTNNHLDRARRRRHVTVSIDQPEAEGVQEHVALRDDAANPERLVMQNRMAAPLESALEALQPVHRRTVELCDLEGATYEEAAAATDCPIGTIRSRLHRAHKAIRGFLERLGTEQPEAVELPIERASSRRAFLRMSTAAAAGAAFASVAAGDPAHAANGPLRVRVWFEGGNAHPDVTALLEGLGTDSGVEATLASALGPDHGLSDTALAETDVLIWCARTDQSSLPSDRLRAITHRVKDQGMGFIALHGAEASQPFQALVGTTEASPETTAAAAAPLALRVTAPRHPIVQGVTSFSLRQVSALPTGTPLPQPEVVILDGTAPGTDRREWQGMVWKTGKGRVFAFRPGHATLPIHHQPEVRQIMRNALRWTAGR